MTVKVREMDDRKHMLIVRHTCPNTFVLHASSCLSEVRVSHRATHVSLPMSCGASCLTLPSVKEKGYGEKECSDKYSTKAGKPDPKCPLNIT